MSKATRLIEQMQAMNTEVIKIAEGCSEEQWHLPVADGDGRPVGVVFHHIAIAYPFSLDWATKIGNGEGLPAFGREELEAFNAKHAQDNASLPRADTIALLQQVTEETAVSLQALSDDQLERTAPNPLVGGKAFSGEWVMQAFAIGHADGHLNAIKATLAEA